MKVKSIMVVAGMVSGWVMARYDMLCPVLCGLALFFSDLPYPDMTVRYGARNGWEEPESRACVFV